MKKSVKVLVMCVIGGVGLVMSCGGGGGGGGGRAVALFADTDYVNYDTNDNTAEAGNVERTLEHLSFGAVAFTGITIGPLGEALGGRRALAIPALKPLGPDLATDLQPSAELLIQDYVENGGLLILFGAENKSLAVANETFNYAMSFGGEVSAADTISLIPFEAAGTVFEGGPSVLSVPSLVTTIDTTTLPLTARMIYTDTSGRPVVTLVPEGSGFVICLGWNWYWGQWVSGDPIVNGDDGGWIEVLDRALR